MRSIKEIIQRKTLRIPKGMEKMQFLFLLVLALTFWSEMKILFLSNAKQKTL